jgi:hypothetical protein
VRLAGLDGEHIAHLDTYRLVAGPNCRATTRDQVDLGDGAVKVGLINPGVGVSDCHRD